jgi:predicted TIM-barrel fold metal-dependent hydrolase
VSIDAHLHLWNTERLRYEWLQRPADPSWTAADLRDVVEFAFGLFGPDRLMFGSDWPVAELGGGYAKARAELGRLFDQLPRPGGDGWQAGATITSTHSHQR